MHNQMHNQTTCFVLQAQKCTAKRTTKCTANMKKAAFPTVQRRRETRYSNKNRSNKY